MTEKRDKHIDFADLRREAVAYAQAASGNIWTDFNLHDPGVTLLEQTCFALSEIAYQSTHKTRDLLTDHDMAGPGRKTPPSEVLGDKLDYDGLALFDPRSVLPSDPVTDADLAAYLSHPQDVARVRVQPNRSTGLYTLTVIPAVGAKTGPRARQSPEDRGVIATAALAAVKAAFEQRRPLACDAQKVRVARKQRAILTGQIEITPTAKPEKVAASIYYHASAILRGQPSSADLAKAATRSDVYDTPEAYQRSLSQQDNEVADLNDSLLVFRAIPGVSDIADLSLKLLDLVAPDQAALPSYLSLVFPTRPDQIELSLTQNDDPVALDLTLLQEELIRASAEYISHTHHHLDEADWDVLIDGRRRDFTRADVDAMLPMLYRATRHLGDDAPAWDQFQTYRGAIDSHLSAMSGDLADLPTVFQADTALETDDPATHRRRIELLDYLIALQGEQMPATKHTGLHLYRSAQQRQRFRLSWRLRFLRALPALNAARGTGPHGTRPGGFMAKFGLLADLPVQTCAGLTEGLAKLGLTLDADAIAPAPNLPRKDLLLPVNPFDMLVPLDENATPLDGPELLAASPWIEGNTVSTELFERAADPANLAIAPHAGGKWQVLFDGGDPENLYRCQVLADKAPAMALTNRLRAGWRQLHQQGEGAYLVEDILLRQTSRDFRPNSATLVLTGWTARTRKPAYRAYIRDLVDRLAPAHVLIRIRWLSILDMAVFEELHSGMTNSRTLDDRTRAHLRTLLARVEDAV